MKPTLYVLLTICTLLSVSNLTFTQGRPEREPEVIDISKFDDSIRHWMNEAGRKFPYERFESSQVKEIADNLLMLQNSDGGWPKNVDWLAKLDRELIFSKLTDLEKPSTCDNRNTYSQIEYLAKAYMATKLEKYRGGAERGLEFILASQNASGGWRGADVDAITFNDDLMTGVMNLLQDVVEGRECYAWVTGDQRLRVRNALGRAVAVTLQCQIIVNGKRTAWCQQHDHRTLQPVKARSYELSSITAMETAGIIEFLMRIKSPSPDIDTAITSAVEWLEKSAIHGIRLERIDTDTLRALSAAYKRYDAVVVQDGNAPLIWARYYEVDSNRPFFCNRDGVKVFSLAEVDRERRIGYQWYGTWPEKVLRVEYPQWVKSH